MIKKYLDWLRRFLGTCFGFVIFGIAGIGFKLVLLPYTRHAERNTLAQQLQARRLVAGVWRLFLRYVVWAGVLTYELEGFERLGKPGQLILANHPSLLDVLFFVGYVPGVNCVVKYDLLNNPVMTSPIKACGFILNDQSEALLKVVDDVLQNGQSLLIFPEGTRTVLNEPIGFHRGAVSLGLRSAKVITPVVIRQSPPHFKKNQPWYQIPKVKICYRLTVGEDIDPAQWLAEKPLPIAARRLNRHLEDYFNREVL